MLTELEIELKLRGVSELTIKSYLYHNKKFLEFIKKDPEEIEEIDVKKYLSYLVSNGISNSSIALVKSALNFYYYEMKKKNFDIKTPKIPKKLPTVLTKEEVQKIIGAAHNQKHKLIMEFLYSTGVRIGELVKIKKQDLELGQNIGWIRYGKGAKDRMIFLSKKLSSQMGEYLSNKSEDSEFIFSTNGKSLTPRAVQKLVSKIAKSVYIPKRVTPHVLRHSFATHLLEAGVDIRKIQVLLGHTSLNTTQIYASVSKTELQKIKNPLDEINLI